MLGSLILYLKGMKIMMFQLSGFYCALSSLVRQNFRSNPTQHSSLHLAMLLRQSNKSRGHKVDAVQAMRGFCGVRVAGQRRFFFRV